MTKVNGARQYSRLRWRHLDADFPVEIVSEYDAHGWECRKIEYFADGTLGYSSFEESAGGVHLSLIQRPADDEVSSNPELVIEPISGEEFDRIWNEAHQRPIRLIRLSAEKSLH